MVNLTFTHRLPNYCIFFFFCARTPRFSYILGKRACKWKLAKSYCIRTYVPLLLASRYGGGIKNAAWHVQSPLSLGWRFFTSNKATPFGRLPSNLYFPSYSELMPFVPACVCSDDKVSFFRVVFRSCVFQ